MKGSIRQISLRCRGFGSPVPVGTEGVMADPTRSSTSYCHALSVGNQAGVLVHTTGRTSQEGRKKNPKREDGKQPQEKKRPSGAQQRKLRGVRKTRRLRKTRSVRKKANKLAGMRGTQHRPSQDQRSKMRSVAYSFCNVRGLATNLDSVHHFLQVSKPDILFLTETQISPSHATNHLACPGFELHQNFRLKGGVCAYVRSSISASREQQLESPDFDLIWLKLRMTSHLAFICVLYRSPNDNSCAEMFEHLSSQVDHINQRYPSAEVIILGDFNVHNKSWLTHSNKTDPEGIMAEHFAISHNLTQLVNEPTRIPDISSHFANTLDLFLTSDPEKYSLQVNAPLGNSDHCLLTASHLILPEIQTTSRTRRIWHYRSARWDEFCLYLSSFPWSSTCLNSKDPDVISDCVTKVIRTGMDKFIPHSDKPIQNPKPWFNEKCKIAILHKNQTYKVWLSSPTNINHSAFLKARSLCSKTIKFAKSEYVVSIRNKLLSCPSGSKSFWSLAKSIGSNFSTHSFPPLSRDDGTVAADALEKAEVFAEIFAKNSNIDPGNLTPPTLPPTQHSMPKIEFNTEKLKKILMNLNTKKATGPDGIPAIVLKMCAVELTPILRELFQYSLEKGIFPENWKSALIQPIPKKGKKCDPNNYRPIALLPVISKVMEKYINESVLNHLESNNIISDRQYGFRKQRSTADMLAYVSHIWSQAVEGHGESQLVALDISKAFDRVWHSALLSKLPSYGINEQLCLWFSNYLKNRKLSVVVDGVQSTTHNINAGVPQGAVLAPTLFLLFINDLLSITKNAIHSFADDSTLHSSYCTKNPTTAQQTQTSRQQQANLLSSDLDLILAWGKRNFVTFNASKTQTCTISCKRSTNECNPRMNGNSIAPKDTVSLLGVTITNNHNWHSHVSSIAKSAACKLGFLFRSKNYFSAENLLTLYKSQIRPCLEYCSNVWGAAPKTTLAMLDSIQRRAIRLIGNENLTASLPPLQLRRDVGDLALFYRYFNGRCSDEIAGIIPKLAVPKRCTRQTSQSHCFTVELKTNRTKQFDCSFVPRTARLWNSMPQDVFPDSFNLQSFKSRVNKFLSSKSLHYMQSM